MQTGQGLQAWTSRAATGLRRAWRRLSGTSVVDLLLAERGQWAMWVPVLFGAGIALYFILPWQLAPAPLLLLSAASALAVALLRRHWPSVFPAGLAVWLVLAGFSLMTWRSEDVAAPVLERRIGAAIVEGRVVLNEPRDAGHRLTLEAVWIERLDPAITPERIRVTLPAGGETLRPGQRVRMRAMLSPPSGPALPGGFDFARLAWFQQLGAVGVASGLPIVLPMDSSLTWRERFSVWLHLQQQDITGRIIAALPGTEGTIAAALMTGVRGPIPEEIDDAFRDSGLAHVLSISGLHLVLVGGILFAAVRALLALSPYLALHWPIKKWAAVAGLLGTAAYMLLSGSALATQRSFVMVALGFLAVLADRRALSLRSLALAGIILLLLAPESLLDAGLQMSFGAVLALVAGFEAIEPRLARWRVQAGPLRVAALWLLGAMLTSLVAGLGSGIFAAYHFNRFADYALISNLLASPLVSFWIMPLAMLAFALMPFGLEAWALVPMGWGVDILADIALWVAGWPGAVLVAPAMPGWCLGALAMGLAWLCIWRLPWRWLGLLPILAALAMPWLIPLPDILVSNDGRRIALRGGEAGTYMFSSPAIAAPGAIAPRGFEAETWWRRLGAPMLVPWPNGRRGYAASADGSLRCEPQGCTARLKGWVVALPRGEAALSEDCRGADIVIAPFPVRQRCPSARLVVDRFDVWRRGAVEIYLGARGDLEQVSVADRRPAKPWVPVRGRRATRADAPRRGEAPVGMDQEYADDAVP